MLRCGGATLALHILSRNSSELVALHAGINLHLDDLDAGIEAVLLAVGEQDAEVGK